MTRTAPRTRLRRACLLAFALCAVHHTAAAAADGAALARDAAARYAAGKYDEAAPLWQQAGAAYAGQGDPLNQAMALGNLSLTQQHRGNWAAAAEAAEQSLALLSHADGTAAGKRIRAGALEIAARLHQEQGAPRQAVTEWEEAAALYEELELATPSQLARIRQAESLRSLGLLSEALLLYSKVLRLSVRVDARSARILFSAENLGALAKRPARRNDTIALRSLGEVLRTIGELATSRTALRLSRGMARQLKDNELLAQAWLQLGETEVSLATREAVGARLGSGYDARALALHLDQALHCFKQAAAPGGAEATRVKARARILRLALDRELWADYLPLAEAEKQAELPPILAFTRSGGTTETVMAFDTLDPEAGPNGVVAVDWPEPKEMWSPLTQETNRLPKDEAGVETRFHLSESLLRLAAQEKEAKPAAQTLLDEARQQAAALGNTRIHAYALLRQARLAHARKAWAEAERLSHQALLHAPPSRAPDLAYQALWQRGRTRLRLGKRTDAIQDYTQAIAILQSLRCDLAAVGTEVQFSFQEAVEPVYRELASLLLADEDAGAAQEARLLQARELIESLQLAELDNFFQDACIATRPVQLEKVAAKAAILYTIVLPERLEVIAALPGQPVAHHATAIKQSAVEDTILDLRLALSAAGGRLAPEDTVKELSGKVYDWLLRPLETPLAAAGVDTLVFILDGDLRNLPMAALHDGKQYLVERYGLALAPGLQLVDPQPLPHKQLKVLIAAVSEEHPPFSPLPQVEVEVERISHTLPATVLLNSGFTADAFTEALAGTRPQIVHLATHGQFSSQADQTFVLTGEGHLPAHDLGRILRRHLLTQGPVELLVLSACQTARGDKRAGLGLAGVAVRAGARSTIGSLWSVSDEATSLLMQNLYGELTAGPVAKSQALRRSQQKILQHEKFKHPYYWAPFVLLGNWL